MDSGSELAVGSTLALRHDIEQTRVALGQKLHALNYELRETVTEASDRFREGLENVKEQFDPSVQLQRHPAFFCATGFLFGFLLQGYVAARNSEPARMMKAEHGPNREGYEPQRASLVSSLAPVVVDALVGLFRAKR